MRGQVGVVRLGTGRFALLESMNWLVARGTEPVATRGVQVGQFSLRGGVHLRWEAVCVGKHGVCPAGRCLRLALRSIQHRLTVTMHATPLRCRHTRLQLQLDLPAFNQTASSFPPNLLTFPFKRLVLVYCHLHLHLHWVWL